MAMKISSVTPTFNRAATLPAPLELLALRRDNFNLESIVVNDHYRKCIRYLVRANNDARFGWI